MNTFTRLLAVLILFGPWLGPCIAQDTHEVHGRVVDEDGRPVAGVRIGTNWAFEGDGATARWRADAKSTENPEVRTDAEGAFSGTIYRRGRPVALIAFDVAGRRGGIAIVDEDHLDEECTVTLRLLVRVRGRVEVAEPTLDDSPLYVYVFDPRAPIAIVRAIEQDRTFSFALPPGPYEYTVSCKDLQKTRGQILLDAQTPDVDLGTIELLPTNLAEHYGKPPPPWNITAARGVSPEVALSDFRGKWILIEFWAHW